MVNYLSSEDMEVITERQQFMRALRAIANADVTEIALDPDWPRRIAAAALRGEDIRED